MGPPGADRTQVDPMLATWTLLSGTFVLPTTRHNIHSLGPDTFCSYNRSWYFPDIWVSNLIVKMLCRECLSIVISFYIISQYVHEDAIVEIFTSIHASCLLNLGTLNFVSFFNASFHTYFVSSCMIMKVCIYWLKLSNSHKVYFIFFMASFSCVVSIYICGANLRICLYAWFWLLRLVVLSVNCSLPYCNNCSSPEVCAACDTGYVLDTMANECKRENYTCTSLDPTHTSTKTTPLVEQKSFPIKSRVLIQNAIRQ